MAEIESYPRKQHHVPEPNQANSSKYFTRFLYKSALVVIFLVIIPLFPSQAPEFINQTVPTRSWELLHLIFVGIAVSYGLFSRRNEDSSDKEAVNRPSKFDNAQSYVSRIFQVSSVFDEEPEISPGSDETKVVQTWSSQYHRNEAVVVVAKESDSSKVREKPLLLPVRRLKSRVPDDSTESGHEHERSTVSGPVTRSSFNLGSKLRNQQFRDVDRVELEEKEKEKSTDTVVLPSPIPWRSRSGRMEPKEVIQSLGSDEETQLNKNWPEPRPSRSQSSGHPRLSTSNSLPKVAPSPSLSSPRKLSPTNSISLESQAKGAEDFVRKKSFRKDPPPPPPPPPMFFKSSSMRPTPTSRVDGASSNTEVRRVNSEIEMKPRSFNDGSSLGRSVRTIRAGERQGMEDGEEAFVEKTQRKRVTFDPSATAFTVEKPGRESFPAAPVQEPSFEFAEIPKNEEKYDFLEGLVSQSDEDSESDDEEDDTVAAAISSGIKEAPSGSPVSDGGPDVDKKADEFIAKFREQIRLQRIESIKRSSAELSRKVQR